MSSVMPTSRQQEYGRNGDDDDIGEEIIRTTSNNHNNNNKNALLVLACLQNSLFGGLIYGWASIDRTLLHPYLDWMQTTQVFSWSCIVGMISPLLLGGFVLDYMGPRACSVSSHICIGIGCGLFAVADSFVSFVIAASLMAFGGPGIGLSIIHLANLFPENKFLALSVLNGSLSFSFAVFALLDVLWEMGYDSAWLFSSLSFLVILSLLLSIRYWTDTAFEPPSPYHADRKHTAEDDFVEATTEHQHLLEQPLDSYLRIVDHPPSDHRHHHDAATASLQRTESFRVSEKALAMGNEKLVSLKDMPFRDQLLSGTYLRSLIVFLVVCFLTNFYVASFSIEMADCNDYSSREQHSLARTLTLIMGNGVWFSILVGLLMDRVGLVVCAILTLALGQVQFLLLVWRGDHPFWMVASFVVYILFRQWLYPVYIATLTHQLGFKYFGLLSGIGFALAGLVQSLMPSLVRLAQGTCHFTKSDPETLSSCDTGRWKQMHVVEIVVLGVLMVLPCIDHLSAIEREKNAKRFLNALITRSFSSYQTFGQPSSSRRLRNEVDCIVEEKEETPLTS